jgi:putative ABC transport system substrate-binding protein
MRRREFIAALGGAAAWPVVLRAQQTERVRQIGVLMALAQNDPLQESYLEPLRKGLRAAGWAEGKNIHVEYRWAGDNLHQLEVLAKEIVATRPDVILAHTSPALAALMKETTSVPIVFLTVTEPVAQGFVKSLARPGGNVTGFTNFESSMGGKWVDLLREIAPQVKQAKVIFNPDTAPGAGAIILESIVAGAKSFGIDITAAPVHDPVEIEAAIAAMRDMSSAGLIVPPDVFLNVHRKQIIQLAAQYRVPAVYYHDYFTRNGGLVSYSVDAPDLFRRAGTYVDRILNGTSPGNLPVQAPTKFELVINLKVAKALDIKIPESFLLRADEVIE